MSELNSVNGVTRDEGSQGLNPEKGTNAGGNTNKEAKTGTPSRVPEEELSSEPAGALRGERSRGVNAFNIVPGDRKLPEIREELQEFRKELQEFVRSSGGQYQQGENVPNGTTQAPSNPGQGSVKTERGGVPI